MTYILDRFENGLAVLVSKDGKTVTVSRDDIAGRREGDVFTFIDGVPIYDGNETEKRKNAIKARFTKLVKRR